MATSLRAWTVVLAFMACLFTAGCSEVSTMPVSGGDSELQQQLGRIEKVSVLTTDGQEVFIDTKQFVKHVSQEVSLIGPHWQSLKQEDIRFTLIVYRAQAAPYVLEIGPGDETVTRFYRWLRKETAEVLFDQIHLRSLEVRASDLDQSYIPTEEEATEVWNLLQEAEYRETNEAVYYPLYPGYRLFINTGERSLETRLLSPSVISVSLGKEEFRYSIPTTLFSQVKNWLPPQLSLRKSEFDPLFKTTRITIVSPNDSNAQMIETAESSELQGVLHQFVRLIKSAPPAQDSLVAGQKEKWYIRLQTESGETSIQIYGDYFRVNGKMYRQPEVNSLIPILVKMGQKHSSSS